MFKIKNINIDGGRLRKDFRYRVCATETPLFTWSVISGEKDDFQTAYRIVVLSTGSIYWDSGWTESSQQKASYAGLSLPCGVRLDILLTVRDIYGNESDTRSDYFYYGETAWTAPWIAPSRDISRRAVYFKREFQPSKTIKTACMYACGLGYHKIYLNGQSLDSSKMDPAHTDYTKTCCYTVLPELERYLASGVNSIGVILAEGWRRNDSKFINDMLSQHRTVTFDGIPQLSLMLDITYTDGSTERIVTDDRWTWTHGAIVSSNLFDGEIYDASQEISDWSIAGKCGSYFTSAIIVPAPGGEMIPMTLEPIREMAVYPALSVSNAAKGSFTVDFGQNIAGVVRMNMPHNMKKGDRITIKHMEFLDEDGTLYLPNLRGAKAEDTYIASGDGRDLEIWQPEFTYHGFRYAQIEGLGDTCDKDDLFAVSLYTDLDNGSYFTCGDPLADRIQKNIVQTERANMHSILTDCPQRDERMGWMNDATVRFDETPYNFNIGRMFPKIVRDLLDVQGTDGSITCTAPFVFGARPADPVCSSFLVAGLQSLMHTGNSEIIRSAYQGFANWENCLTAHTDGYIVNYSYYGDWASPAAVCIGEDGAFSSVTPGDFMSTGYYYFNARTLAKFAEIAGITDDIAKWSELAGNIRLAMLEKWYDADTGKMATGSQACQSFALWLGIIPPQDCQKAADLIHADLVQNAYVITTGNLCTRYMLEVLSQYGYIDDAWRIMTRKEYPSFGYTIQHEATTIWERFELKKNPNMNSHNHPMYGSAGYFFFACIGGITPLAPAYDKVKIQPYLPADLLSAHICADTVKGDIVVKWNKRYGKTYLYVTIPFGVEAEVNFNGEVHTAKSGFHVYECDLQ